MLTVTGRCTSTRGAVLPLKEHTIRKPLKEFVKASNKGERVEVVGY